MNIRNVVLVLCVGYASGCTAMRASSAGAGCSASGGLLSSLWPVSLYDEICGGSSIKLEDAVLKYEEGFPEGAYARFLFYCDRTSNTDKQLETLCKTFDETTGEKVLDYMIIDYIVRQHHCFCYELVTLVSKYINKTIGEARLFRESLVTLPGKIFWRGVMTGLLWSRLFSDAQFASENDYFHEITRSLAMAVSAAPPIDSKYSDLVGDDILKKRKEKYYPHLVSAKLAASRSDIDLLTSRSTLSSSEEDTLRKRKEAREMLES